MFIFKYLTNVFYIQFGFSLDTYIFMKFILINLNKGYKYNNNKKYYILNLCSNNY